MPCDVACDGHTGLHPEVRHTQPTDTVRTERRVYSLGFCLSALVSEVAHSGPTLCDPMDCSPPGSSVHGILQARILEWVAISFSRGSS